MLRDFSRKRVVFLRASAIAGMGYFFMRNPQFLQSEMKLLKGLFSNALKDDLSIKRQVLTSFHAMLASIETDAASSELVTSRSGGGRGGGSGGGGATPRGGGRNGQKMKPSHEVLVLGDDSPESQFMAAAVRKHMSSVLTLMLDRDAKTRLRAVMLVGLMHEQRLLQPQTGISELIALQGDCVEPSMRDKALKLLVKVHSRRPDVLKQRFIAGMSEAFEFQRHIVRKGVHAVWTPSLLSAQRSGVASDAPRSYFADVYKTCISKNKRARQHVLKGIVALWPQYNRSLGSINLVRVDGDAGGAGAAAGHGGAAAAGARVGVGASPPRRNGNREVKAAKMLLSPQRRSKAKAAGESKLSESSLDAAVECDSLAFLTFAARTLAHLPYTTQDEPLYVIDLINNYVSLHASSLQDHLVAHHAAAAAARGGSQTKELLHASASASIAGVATLVELHHDAAAMSALLFVKRFLKSSYMLSDDVCQTYSSSSSSASSSAKKEKARSVTHATRTPSLFSDDFVDLLDELERANHSRGNDPDADAEDEDSDDAPSSAAMRDVFAAQFRLFQKAMRDDPLDSTFDKHDGTVPEKKKRKASASRKRKAKAEAGEKAKKKAKAKAAAAKKRKKKKKKKKGGMEDDDEGDSGEEWQPPP